MRNWTVILLFAPLYLFVLFFGLGPVLLADGSWSERLVTALIVFLILAVFTKILQRVLRAGRKGQ